MSAPLVKVENLSRVFDVSKPWLNRALEGLPRRLLSAVADVSFSIAAHQTFALVGESGSGKSTVARMIVGLVQPSDGRVTIGGISMHGPDDAPERRKLRHRIQMVFQDPYASLNPRWRAFDIVAEPILAFGLSATRAEVTRKVGELLTLVGLDPAHGSHYPHEFSGGMRQRIAIARALASHPDFIVCDEPTSALDVSVQAQILNLMRDLQDQLGLTYLFISHNLAVVRHMANRIGVMYLGRLVEIADAKTLFSSPRHPYTRMLLEAVPDLEMSGRPRKAVQGEPPNPLNLPSGCAFRPRCPYAAPRCSVELPQLKPDKSAMVACHAVAEGRI
jgi:peptide/nickel transport system ATP-binding protein